MSRLVMKFGGTSVADMDRIRRVGRLVAAEVAAGHQVAVVVSAMSGTTNVLVAWTDAAGPAAQGLPRAYLRFRRRARPGGGLEKPGKPLIIPASDK